MRIDLDNQEINTILAALRTYQEAGYGQLSKRPPRIQEIASDNFQTTSLDDTDIDALCERINCGD